MEIIKLVKNSILEHSKLILTIICFLTLAYFLTVILPLSEHEKSLSIIISLFAMLFSSYSIFRDNIYGFRLKVFVRDYMIPGIIGGKMPISESDNINLPLALPVHYINKGYGEGIVEDIILLIVDSQDKKIIKYYTPLLEINEKDFLKGKRAIHAENIEKTFSEFPLSGKTATRRLILFSQEENSKEYPFSGWKIDVEYQADFYIKTSNSHKYRRYGSIKIKMLQKQFDEWRKNNTIYVASSRGKIVV
jgi:hypothetical protein